MRSQLSLSAIVAMAAAVSAQNSTITPTSSGVALTTSTVYGTSIYTITSCAPTVTNCPAGPHVTTEIVSLYTTVCPVAAAATTAPAAPPASGSSQCASMCTAAFVNCKSQPLENNAYCAATYASCLGYNPFASGAPSPTACVTPAATAAPAPSKSAVGTVGPVPTTTPASVVPFTGAAGSTKPVMGLLALGLLAML